MSEKLGSPQVECERYGVLSSDGTHELAVVLYCALDYIETPITYERNNAQPYVSLVDYLSKASCKAVIQIVHGMAEHKGRYDTFARYLASLGYAVVVYDQVGHGQSVVNADEYGHIGANPGVQLWIDDIAQVRNWIDSFAPHPCHILFGHSMGSLLSRAFVVSNPQVFDALILSGTAHPSRAKVKIAKQVARLLAAIKGEHYRSPFLHQQTVGVFNNAIKHPRTPCDWICADEAAVDGYIADPMCGFMFSTAANIALCDAILKATDEDTVGCVARFLPILFVSGSQDPVGENSQAVLRAQEFYKRAGASPDCLLYEGKRHELLQERGHEVVFQDIAAWIERKAFLRSDERGV